MTYSDGFTDGYKAKERELEKYRWHDLSKNPRDLPAVYTCVFVYMKHRDSASDDYVYAYRENGEWFEAEHDEAFTECYCMEYWDVVAWKEIEPFEESI